MNALERKNNNEETNSPSSRSRLDGLRDGKFPYGFPGLYDRADYDLGNAGTAYPSGYDYDNGSPDDNYGSPFA